MSIQYDYEAIVIGSGFGGSINTCRLSKKWPGQVLLLERGKRYPMGSFARSPHDMARNFWNLPQEKRDMPEKLQGEESHGLFDIRNFDHMDAVISAGLGGGSLIYANVFLQPPDEVFDHNWPANAQKNVLQPYYAIAKQVLGARPIPQNEEPRRKIIRTGLFQNFAKADGHDSQLLDINVFFGNDFDNPTPIGVQEKTSMEQYKLPVCIALNVMSAVTLTQKNTLDLNYLHVAEHRYQAHIQTQVLAQKIVPVDASGQDNPAMSGEFGYRVYWQDLKDAHKECSALTRRVVVSAGTLGTNELLMRCRDLHKTLPNISQQLGRHFSGNGDFLSFVIAGDKAADPNYGPVITQGTDYNLFKNFDRDKAFILEDASYPNFAAWYTEGVKPGVSQLHALFRTIRLAFARFVHGISTGHLGYALSSLLKNDLSYNTSVLLCMGLDKGDGVMSLNKQGYLHVKWPYKNSMSLYNAILATGERFKKWCGGKAFIPMPNWLWPMRRNVTVHSLGGCRLADSPEQGVTSAELATFGQVFGYTGLYVADGSLLPTAVGANPIATISAVSERVAEGITGITPTAEL